MKNQETQLAMFIDAAMDLNWSDKLDAIKDILDMLPAAQLEIFSNELGREAHIRLRSGD